MNSKLSARLVQTNDLDQICKLPLNQEELFFMFPKANFPLTVAQLQAAIENRTDSTVFLYNSGIVGFANFYEVQINEYCSIGNVIIHSNYRNKGIGKYLIEKLESIAIDKYNAKEIHISCFCTNTRGILLYSKLGYIPYGIEERLDYLNNKTALIKMKRCL